MKEYITDVELKEIITKTFSNCLREKERFMIEQEYDHVQSNMLCNILIIDRHLYTRHFSDGVIIPNCVRPETLEEKLTCHFKTLNTKENINYIITQISNKTSVLGIKDLLVPINREFKNFLEYTECLGFRITNKRSYRTDFGFNYMTIFADIVFCESKVITHSFVKNFPLPLCKMVNPNSSLQPNLYPLEYYFPSDEGYIDNLIKNLRVKVFENQLLEKGKGH